jgi:hypothetical protein
MTGESERRALAKLLAGFADRQVGSAAELEAWAHDSHALVTRLDTEFAEASKSLSEDEWWYVVRYLDDADIRLKEPTSAYTQQQNDRLRKIIAKLEST